MPTSSLRAVAALLGSRSVGTMAAGLALPRPVSVRALIGRAPTRILQRWELLTPLTIAVDEANAAWHAGHVEDVYTLDADRVLIASATGGVWLARTDAATDPLPLSDAWPEVDLHAFTGGPRNPRHVVVGGNGVLRETAANSLLASARLAGVRSARTLAQRLGAAPPISVRRLLALTPDAPLFDWRDIALVDTAGAALGLNVRQLAVVTDLQPAKLVLASDSGVYWADVPAFGQGYAFTLALGMPQVQCLAVALASRAPGQPVRSVVCSPTGAIASASSNGLYVGDWQGGNLVFQRARHDGDIDFVQWQFAVVASSSADRSVLYAAVSASGTATLRLRSTLRIAFKTPPFSLARLAKALGQPLPATLSTLIRRVDPPLAYDLLYAVLGSRDGGASWAPVGPRRTVKESVLLPRDPGQTQGGYNLSIAVSPADPDLVALGWRIGPWIGRATPQAFVWEEHGDRSDRPGFSPHIHSDSHGLHFDPRDASGRTLLACTDGGVVITRDLCASFSSAMNRRLPTLQFQSYPAHGGGFNGASGSGPRTAGLSTGALQDNGIVFTSRQNGAQQPWRRRVGGDGFVAIVLDDDQMLYWHNDAVPAARIARWNGNGFDADREIPVRTAGPGAPAGQLLLSPLGEPVQRPGFRRPGTNQRLLAVAAWDSGGTARDLWGLFLDDDGNNATWDFLAALGSATGDAVTAIGSDSGATVFVGTAQGRLLACDAASGSLTPMAVDPALALPGGQVYQFAFLNGGIALARYGGALLRFDPGANRWVAAGGNGLPTDEGQLQFMAADTVRVPAMLYTATDVSVHASWDAGANWLPVGTGLPRRCHPSTLRLVAAAGQQRSLTLFTYGRSAWTAALQ